MACSQALVQLVEQLLQRHLLFRNSLQERLCAEHWKSLLGDILVQLIGQNDVSSGCRRVCACACARLNTHTCLQTVFSDTYVGYTSTLASFLCLEMNRLNHPDSNGDKVQVLDTHAHARTHARTHLCVLSRGIRRTERKWSCCRCCWHLWPEFTPT